MLKKLIGGRKTILMALITQFILQQTFKLTITQQQLQKMLIRPIRCSACSNGVKQLIQSRSSFGYVKREREKTFKWSSIIENYEKIKLVIFQYILGTYQNSNQQIVILAMQIFILPKNDNQKISKFYVEPLEFNKQLHFFSLYSIEYLNNFNNLILLKISFPCRHKRNQQSKKKIYFKNIFSRIFSITLNKFLMKTKKVIIFKQFFLQIISYQLLEMMRIRSKEKKNIEMKDTFSLFKAFGEQLEICLFKKNPQWVLQNQNSKFMTILEDKDDQKLIFHFRLTEQTEAMTNVFYNQQYRTVNIHSYLLKNYLPFCVSENYSRKILFKIFQKLNQSIDIWKNNDQTKQNGFTFNINPLSGFISLDFQTLLAKKKFRGSLLCNDYIFCTSNIIIRSVQYLYNLIPLFDYIRQNRTPFKLPEELSWVYKVYPQKKKQSIEKLNLLRQIVQSSASQENINIEMDNPPSYEKTKNHFLKYFKEWNPDIKQIFHLFDTNHELRGLFTPYQIVNKISQSYSCSLNISQQQNSILQYIQIVNETEEIEWIPIAEGGFGLIEKAFISYHIYDQKGEVSYLHGARQGFMVRKSDKSTKEKLDHEKYILQILKSEYHQNIKAHFISEQPQFQKYIFTKYEPEQSLSSFLQSNSLTISLETIISLLNEIIHGLYFLHSFKIVHLDIKPGNIIIANNIKAMISDFGEAFYLQDNPLKHQHSHGFSIPYVAPEIFNHEVLFHPKIDNYAFGVTAFKCLLGKHAFDCYENKVKFLNKLIDGKTTPFFSPERITNYGMESFVHILINLILKCFSFEQKDRPSSFYLVMVFQISHQYLSMLC